MGEQKKLLKLNLLYALVLILVYIGVTGVYTNHVEASPYQINGEANKGIIEDGSLVDIQITKVWDDYDNAYGTRPQAVTIYLCENGEEIYSIDLSEKNDWKWCFMELEKYDLQGNIIDYQVRQKEVSGYTTTYFMEDNKVKVIDEIDKGLYTKPSANQLSYENSNTSENDTRKTSELMKKYGSYVQVEKNQIEIIVLWIILLIGSTILAKCNIANET